MRTVRPLVIIVTVLLAGLANLRSAVGEIRYTITSLGSLGGNYTFPLGINDNGQVTGMSYLSGNPTVGGTYHAFFYPVNGSIKDLSTLGGTNSTAYKSNLNGSIIGSSDTVSSGMHGFVTTVNGPMVDLGLATNGSFLTAYGINANGQIAGVSLANQAIQRNSNGTVTNIGVFSGGTYSYGNGNNSSGKVAGQGDGTGINTHGFLYSGTTPPTDLGTLGGSISRAYDVNDNGWVVGDSTLSNGRMHAFLWTGSGPMQDLGSLASNTDSQAFSINGSNTIVGEANSRAFIYTSADGMIDLNNYIDPQSGWTLRHAHYINNQGQIVGWGTNATTGANGASAFLLTPVPEPATLGMCVGASAVLLLRRRARH